MMRVFIRDTFDHFKLLLTARGVRNCLFHRSKQRTTEFRRGHLAIGFSLALSLCVFSPISQAEETSKPASESVLSSLDIYLLIGQSNMAGRAPFSGEDAAVIPDCYLLDAKDQWVPAKNPFNQYSSIRKNLGMQKMNPGYMFARTMLAKEKGVSLGLVVNAKGGTRIEQWEKGTHFYQEAIRRTKIATQSGTLKGILWHQGEGNKTDADYLEKLTKLIADLRHDLGDPNLPFVAGQINDLSLINGQIAKLPETVPFTGYASSDGLQAMDRWHFDTASMKLLGKRYAEAMLKIQHAEDRARTSDAEK